MQMPRGCANWFSPLPSRPPTFPIIRTDVSPIPPSGVSPTAATASSRRLHVHAHGLFPLSGGVFAEQTALHTSILLVAKCGVSVLIINRPHPLNRKRKNEWEVMPSLIIIPSSSSFSSLFVEGREGYVPRFRRSLVEGKKARRRWCIYMRLARLVVAVAVAIARMLSFSTTSRSAHALKCGGAFGHKPLLHRPLLASTHRTVSSYPVSSAYGAARDADAAAAAGAAAAVAYPNFAFDIAKQATASRARLGQLRTPHGTIDTPNFVFCATKAAM